MSHRVSSSFTILSHVSACKLAVLFILCFCLNAQAQQRSVKVNEKDLPAFHKVDDHYFRGGQPTEGGFRQLAQMGIKTVIDLRGNYGERAGHEEELVLLLGMNYINLPLSNWREPDEEKIQRFIALLRNNKNLPVFVHCWQGKDRAGVATGIYRIEFYNWTGEQAYEEMKQCGFFDFSLFRHGMRDYVLNYVEHKAQEGKNNITKQPLKDSAENSSEKKRFLSWFQPEDSSKKKRLLSWFRPLEAKIVLNKTLVARNLLNLPLLHIKSLD